MALSILFFFTVLFLFLSAFFSASETALYSIPRERIHFFELSQQKAYQRVFLLLQDGQRTLLLILIGNTFVNITLAGLINSLLMKVLSSGSPLITLIVATLIIIIFGEMLPKNFAIKKNEHIAIGISGPLIFLKKFLFPVLRVIQYLNQFFLVRFKRHLRKPSPFITIEELRSGVNESARRGIISTEEQSIISGILGEGIQPVRKLMTHRSYLVIIQEDSTISAAIKKLHDSKKLIALVRPKNNPEQIIGTVTMSELLKSVKGAGVKSVLTTPIWVPETMEVAELISFLFNEGYSYACVLDEFGSFSGLFSLPTVMNSILGNAFPSLKPRQTNIKGRTMVFSGGQEIAEMEDWLPSPLKLTAVEVRTLNGLLTNFLGKIPKTGDRFAIDGWNFYIMAASSTRIESVLIRKRNNDDN